MITASLSLRTGRQRNTTPPGQYVPTASTGSRGKSSNHYPVTKRIIANPAEWMMGKAIKIKMIDCFRKKVASDKKLLYGPLIHSNKKKPAKVQIFSRSPNKIKRTRKTFFFLFLKVGD
jgi:hypothetical protein